MSKTTVSPIALARHLKGIDFPVGKEDLIQHARDNNADEAVLREMEAMPDQEFRSMKDVTRAMGQSEEGEEEGGEGRGRSRRSREEESEGESSESSRGEQQKGRRGSDED